MSVVLCARGQANNLADLITSNPNLSELASLINQNNSDLLQITLQLQTPSMTVFAPNNQAILHFKRANPAGVENATLVRNIILNHVLINQTVKSSVIASNMRALSALNRPLWFVKTADRATVNEAKIVAADMMASNGIIHMIDGVLFPLGETITVGQAVMDNPEFSGLKAFVDLAPEIKNMLVNQSHMVTVFAPVNEALPSPDGFSSTEIDAVLKRHIVVNNVLFANYFSRGGRIGTYHGDIMTKYMSDNVYLKNSGDLWSRVVSSAGIPILNGVVHRINGVLGLTTGVNLVEALGLNGLTQLKGKVTNEKLDSALMDKSQNYTIFAPSNSAFEKFTSPSEPLSTILKRHVIKGAVMSSDLKAAQTVQTLNSGETITVTKTHGKVYVEYNGIQGTVISADKKASNGVIHFIDIVLSGAAPLRLSVFLLMPLLAILML
ncbi:transforming growth factor-beta-induced protein ig-h3-like [Liolophura sinensis]|uniref:transforming growth factor-beta-induced protein ig-h3-like n=1 Tax=Liolophura sinensis TaxID=3198878 RepID=UPI003158BFCD